MTSRSLWRITIRTSSALHREYMQQRHTAGRRSRVFVSVMLPTEHTQTEWVNVEDWVDVPRRRQ